MEDWSALGFEPSEQDFSDLGFVPSQKRSGPLEQLIKSALAGAGGSYGDLAKLARIQSEGETPGARARISREATVPLERLYLEAEGAEAGPTSFSLPTSSTLELLLGKAAPQSTSERYAERIGSALGGGAAFGLGKALPILAGAAAAGQTVQEATGSPLAGALTELGTSIAVPASIGRRVVSIKGQEALVKTARDAGLTEKQLTPLLKSEKTLKRLAKIAPRGGKTQETLAETETKLGEYYGKLRQRARELPSISENEEDKLLTSLEDISRDLKTTVKAAPGKQGAIDFIEESRKNLIQNGATPEELISWWQDINEVVPWNTFKGGKKRLAALKKPILETLKSSDSSLANDFEQANKLYSKLKLYQKAATPSFVSQLIRTGEVGSVLVGIGTGNLGLIQKSLGIIGAQGLAQQILQNPRLQNIGKRYVEAQKRNNTRRLLALSRRAEKELGSLIQQPRNNEK